MYFENTLKMNRNEIAFRRRYDHFSKTQKDAFHELKLKTIIRVFSITFFNTLTVYIGESWGSSDVFEV